MGRQQETSRGELHNQNQQDSYAAPVRSSPSFIMRVNLDAKAMFLFVPFCEFSGQLP